MLRAIRLVVDTRASTPGSGRGPQVVKFFHDHSTIDEPSVQSETNRYIANPGQALGYKIGQLTISRLREHARGRARRGVRLPRLPRRGARRRRACRSTCWRSGSTRGSRGAKLPPATH